jgi:hypothetical protein
MMNAQNGTTACKRLGDQDKRARRPDPDAAGPVADDCLLPKERHMQHVDTLSWFSG